MLSPAGGRDQRVPRRVPGRGKGSRQRYVGSLPRAGLDGRRRQCAPIRVVRVDDRSWAMLERRDTRD